MSKELSSAWFIMKMWQTGNIGSHNISKLEGQNSDGYSNINEAIHAMNDFLQSGNWILNSNFYTFTIMQIFEKTDL